VRSKQRKNTSETCPCEDKPEAESKTRGGVEPHHATNGNDAWMNFFSNSMLEEILDIRNVQKAFKQVTANKGAGGIDGMQTDELRDYLNTNWQTLRTSILEGTYRPEAVKKVEIDKENGGKRKLGIPTAIDRLISQSIAQWLSPQYEEEFSNYSYGFRENRNTHQAVYQAQINLNDGYEWVVELDLETFFDRVNHDRLMSLLAKKIADKRTLKLLRAYLNCGVMENGVVIERKEGTPQGSPLAPRTHPQTLSFLGGYRLIEVSFDSIIKSIIFMINGKIAELRIGQTDQPGFCNASEGQTSAADCRAVDGSLWSISNPGLPLYTTGQRDQRKNGDSGKFCGIYRQATTYTDQKDQAIVGNERAIDQQSGLYCAGRIFSQKGSCQKRRNKLRYPLLMIDYGSKSSRRYIISLFQPTSRLFSLNKILMN
jgi:hypothetical protein